MRNNANDRERQDYLSQKGLQVVASGANTKGSTGSGFWCRLRQIPIFRRYKTRSRVKTHSFFPFQGDPPGQYTPVSVQSPYSTPRKRDTRPPTKPTNHQHHLIQRPTYLNGDSKNVTPKSIFSSKAQRVHPRQCNTQNFVFSSVAWPWVN